MANNQQEKVLTAEEVLYNVIKSEQPFGDYSKQEFETWRSKNPDDYAIHIQAMEAYASQSPAVNEGAKEKKYTEDDMADLLQWRELMRDTGILIGLSKEDIVKKYLSLK